KSVLVLSLRIQFSSRVLSSGISLGIRVILGFCRRIFLYLTLITLLSRRFGRPFLVVGVQSSLDRFVVIDERIFVHGLFIEIDNPNIVPIDVSADVLDFFIRTAKYDNWKNPLCITLLLSFYK